MEGWWSWLLVVLLYGAGYSSALIRHRRQSDTWSRNYRPGWESSRGLGQSAFGVGSPRGAQPVYAWGSRNLAERSQSRELAQPQYSPISVQCTEDSMVVMVERDFYGNGKLVKPSDLTLGSCRYGPQTTDTMVVFDNSLQECGSTLEMTPDWIIYSSKLSYTPTSTSNVPIIRSNSAVVPIQCFYPRHGNVSSNAIKPTWIPFSTTISEEERLVFSLRLMTEDWSAPSSSLVFWLGDMFYIEASLDTQNHIPMILFVDSCVATITPDVNSNPRYEIISNNGCLMDGMQEDSSSVFVSPRSQADKLRFMVDAFRFTDSAFSTVRAPPQYWLASNPNFYDHHHIYITCSLRAAPINQTPDPLNKACSYNKASSSWFPVEGPSGICQCCSTRNCATAAGQRMTLASPGRQRGLGKRDIGSHPEKHGLATLGPILVTGGRPNQVSEAGTAQASKMSASHRPLKLWMLVAIGSIVSVVVVFALTMTGKCLLRRYSHKESL